MKGGSVAYNAAKTYIPFQFLQSKDFSENVLNTLTHFLLRNIVTVLKGQMPFLVLFYLTWSLLHQIAKFN
jgi:hypothetical protein